MIKALDKLEFVSSLQRVDSGRKDLDQLSTVPTL